MPHASQPLVSADNEWSPLRSVIVGHSADSCFPSAPAHMIKATMPEEHFASFRPKNRFPAAILDRADAELRHFVQILRDHDVRVYRPSSPDWLVEGGYTASMPRDGLLTVGNTIIEACFAWECRHREIELAFSGILEGLEKDPAVRVVRAPKVEEPNALYEGVRGFGNTSSEKEMNGTDGVHQHQWAINNARPAFDAADFLRFGETVVGQLSNVTNQKGVEYLRKVVPEGYSVEVLETTDEHAMHIDATILPLRKGLLIYNPERVTEEALRKLEVFRDWKLHAYPYQPAPREYPPRYMTSGWLLMNVLSLDEKRVIVEAGDVEFAEFIRKMGMEPIPCPFQHVNSIGGSFHCATVDLVRD